MTVLLRDPVQGILLRDATSGILLRAEDSAVTPWDFVIIGLWESDIVETATDAGSGASRTREIAREFYAWIQYESQDSPNDPDTAKDRHLYVRYQGNQLYKHEFPDPDPGPPYRGIRRTTRIQTFVGTTDDPTAEFPSFPQHIVSSVGSITLFPAGSLPIGRYGKESQAASLLNSDYHDWSMQFPDEYQEEDTGLATQGVDGIPTAYLDFLPALERERRFANEAPYIFSEEDVTSVPFNFDRVKAHSWKINSQLIDQDIELVLDTATFQTSATLDFGSGPTLVNGDMYHLEYTMRTIGGGIDFTDIAVSDQVVHSLQLSPGAGATIGPAERYRGFSLGNMLQGMPWDTDVDIYNDQGFTTNALMGAASRMTWRGFNAWNATSNPDGAGKLDVYVLDNDTPTFDAANEFLTGDLVAALRPKVYVESLARGFKLDTGPQVLSRGALTTADIDICGIGMFSPGRSYRIWEIFWPAMTTTDRSHGVFYYLIGDEIVYLWQDAAEWATLNSTATCFTDLGFTLENPYSPYNELGAATRTTIVVPNAGNPSLNDVTFEMAISLDPAYQNIFDPAGVQSFFRMYWRDVPQDNDYNAANIVLPGVAEGFTHPT